MDPERFDALVQSLARPGSRRRLLGGLLAGSLAPLPAAAKPKRHRAAAADAAGTAGREAATTTAAPAGPQPACLPIGKRCSQKASAGARHGKGKGGKGKHHPTSCTKCCSRYGAAGPDGKPRCTCKSEGIACDGDAQCCSGQCRAGTCTGCPPNTVFCPDGCANLQTDPNHCGSCAKACASGQRCVNGSCVCDGTSCPRGCCQNGTCQRGTENQACGVDGADCQTCQTCTTCDGTQCAAQSGVCCGEASVCQGGTCQACGAGQRCQGGQCVCDATSCPNGCCAGTTCVPIAQQTKQQRGRNGATCQACAGNDTCAGGNPGTPGVCGCTRQCAGKNCGDDDACGGKCDGPCPSECQTCASGVCQNKDNLAACGGANSGLHCCNGVCPPPPTCLAVNACCADDSTCAQQCCTGNWGYPDYTCDSRRSCSVGNTGDRCGSDPDCDDPGSLCSCGRCCFPSGMYCNFDSDCCSNSCPLDTYRCQ